jgi:hypothetical protein
MSCKNGFAKNVFQSDVNNVSAALVYNDVGRILQTTNIREGSGSQAEREQKAIPRGTPRF